MKTLRGIVALLWLITDTLIGCIPLYLLGLLKLVSPRSLQGGLVRGMHRIVQTWAAGNRLMFRTLGITEVHAQWPQTRLAEDAWYLVVSNHQTWADILILQNTFQGRIPILKFFTKRQLRWVPLIGAAMWLLDFPYVHRLSREQIAANPDLAGLDRQATLDACLAFRDHPTSVLSFLEGTRFTAEKHAIQDRPRFQNLLNPKLGGVSYVVTTLADKLDAVIDVTLVYSGGPPTFWELLQGKCPRVDMLVERRELPAAARGASDPDAARDALRPWIESIWREKDERLGGLGAIN